MRNAYRVLLIGLFMMLASSALFAQRPRAVDDSKQQEATQPLPKIVQAKYMGGLFGYQKKQEGTLNFDDRNRRLVFRDKYEKEILSISYEAVAVTFADSESRRKMGPTTERVVLSTVGILGLPAMLAKKKFEYLTIQFKDPDTDLAGVTSFKMKNKEQATAIAHALATKAGLTQRGVIYVRRKDKDTATTTDDQQTSPN